MLYVKDEIGATHRTDLEPNDTELLWDELRPGNKNVMFATCYRPPGMIALQVDSFIDSFINQVEKALDENPDALRIWAPFHTKVPIEISCLL